MDCSSYDIIAVPITAHVRHARHDLPLLEEMGTTTGSSR